MPFVQYRIVEIPRWKLAAGAVLIGVLLCALFILAAGVFLLVLPVVAVGGLLAWLFGSRTMKRNFPAGVIETEYREIEPSRLEQEKNERRDR